MATPMLAHGWALVAPQGAAGAPPGATYQVLAAAAGPAPSARTPAVAPSGTSTAMMDADARPRSEGRMFMLVVLSGTQVPRCLTRSLLWQGRRVIRAQHRTTTHSPRISGPPSRQVRRPGGVRNGGRARCPRAARCPAH